LRFGDTGFTRQKAVAFTWRRGRRPIPFSDSAAGFSVAGRPDARDNGKGPTDGPGLSQPTCGEHKEHPVNRRILIALIVVLLTAGLLTGGAALVAAWRAHRSNDDTNRPDALTPTTAGASASAPAESKVEPKAGDSEQEVELLPPNGLPTLAEFALRLDLEQITAESVDQAMDALEDAARLGPDTREASTPAREEQMEALNDFRRETLPKLLASRDALHEAGVRQVVVLSDAGDDPTDSPLALLRVADDVEPAPVAAALRQTLEALAGVVETDAPDKPVLDHLVVTRWADGWLLARDAELMPEAPEPVTTGYKRLTGAMLRGGDAPVIFVLGTTDGDTNACVAQMQWLNARLELGPSPRVEARARFDTPDAARDFRNMVVWVCQNKTPPPQIIPSRAGDELHVVIKAPTMVALATDIRVSVDHSDAPSPVAERPKREPPPRPEAVEESEEAKAAAARLLPEKGLPLDADLALRVNLATLTNPKLAAVFDALAQAVPQDDKPYHEQLATMRRRLLPAIGDARETLRKAGIRELLVLANLALQELGDPRRDEHDAPGTPRPVFLLRVDADATPAEVKAALNRAAKAAADKLEEVEAGGETRPADRRDAPVIPLAEDLEALAENLAEAEVHRWDDGWLLVRPGGASDKLPDAVRHDNLWLGLGLARAEDAPLVVSYRMSSKARQGAWEGIGGIGGYLTLPGDNLAAGAGQLRWGGAWLELGDKPSLRAVLRFDTAGGANDFRAGFSQALMMMGGFSAMVADGYAAALAVAIADLIPTAREQEVRFEVGPGTLGKVRGQIRAAQPTEE
jgi:hypothetical protein